MIVAALMGGLGLACMLFKRTLLGFLVGVQLLILGATMMFVLAGGSSGNALKGHIFGLFITFANVTQLMVGFALAARLFYLKKKAGIDEVRSLRH